jgi:hypothetical protein
MTNGAETGIAHDIDPLPDEALELSRRSFGQFLVTAGGVAAALALGGCDVDGGVRNHGVSSPEDRKDARDKEYAQRLKDYQADQVPVGVERAQREAVDRLVLRNDGIADTIFDDLARAGSRFDYEDSARWRISNPAADDGKEDRRTVVSASFGLGTMTIEKQAYDNESGNMVRIRAICSLPGFANTPRGVDTKAELIAWAKGAGSKQLRVINLSCRLTPVNNAGELEGGRSTFGEIEATYGVGTDDFGGLSVRSAFGDFDTTLKTFDNQWQAIANVKP